MALSLWDRQPENLAPIAITWDLSCNMILYSQKGLQPQVYPTNCTVIGKYSERIKVGSQSACLTSLTERARGCCTESKPFIVFIWTQTAEIRSQAPDLQEQKALCFSWQISIRTRPLVQKYHSKTLLKEHNLGKPVQGSIVRNKISGRSSVHAWLIRC